METGTFRLVRFNGEEVYRLSEARTFTLPEGADGVRLWFEAESHRPAVTNTCPDAADMGMHPKAEVAVNLPSVDWDALPGRVFVVPAGYDPDRDDYAAMIDYFEHEYLDDNRVEVLGRDGGRLHVRWTATACDVNHYDGSKPRTRVEIDGWFEIDRKMSRGLYPGPRSASYSGPSTGRSGTCFRRTAAASSFPG
ncbi:MAG: hypothetical protein K2X87_33755 [Gemmataceae bacterium]|nr:hypothetical protein [Gemmataceae bacterium]